MDPSSRHIYYWDPTKKQAPLYAADNQGVRNDERERKERRQIIIKSNALSMINAKISNFYHAASTIIITEEGNHWKLLFEVSPNKVDDYEPCSNECDTGIYVLWYFVLLINELPIVYHQSDMKRHRKTLSYLILQCSPTATL